MSQDKTFVHGTIVEADFLNTGQEVDTGLVWGMRLSQSVSGTVETDVVGDPYDTQAPLIVGGKRVWKNGASVAASPSGAAGAQDVFVSTTDLLAPDYTVEVLPTGNTPVAAYFRRIGTGDWDGVSVLDNLKLSHGVQAEADQFNQFTFQTISDSTADVPLTIAGYNNQWTSSATLLSLGSDEGSGYTERMAVDGRGRVSLTGENDTDSVVEVGADGFAATHMYIDASGEIRWGDGTLAKDTVLERTASGTLKVHDDTAGGNGKLDTVALQNSDTGGATWNGAGMVNVLDDLNLASGQVFRIDGVQFNSSMLADAANVAHLAGTETFTGVKTFSVNQIFTAGQQVTGATSIDRQGAASGNTGYASRVGTEANNRFEVLVDGSMNWGAGGASAVDVSLSRPVGTPDVLRIAAGDRFEQAYMASVSEPDVLVNRATMDAAFASGAASRAFSYFIS